MKTYQITYQPNIAPRIIATLIDYGIYFTVVFVYIFCLGTEDAPGHFAIHGLMALPIFLLWFVYFILLEASNQATPGHDIMKLRVIKKNGERISVSDVFKRRIVDWFDFSFAGIPALICIKNTAHYQRMGDLWAGTVVVKRSDITEQEVIF